MRAIIVKTSYDRNGNRLYSARAHGLPLMREQHESGSEQATREALVKRYAAARTEWPTEWVGYTINETTWAYVPRIHADSE